MPVTAFDLLGITPKNHVPSPSWTGLSEKDTTLTSAINLMLSQNVDDGLIALEDFFVPSLNFLLVDDNELTLKTVAKCREGLPSNTRPNAFFRMEAQNKWRGFWGFEVNPTIIGTGDILGNTNNKITEKEFPQHMSHFWGDTQRIFEMAKAMQNREVHTRESL